MLQTLGAGATPVFFNKVVAATSKQLARWVEAMAAVTAPIGTSSVLRFAPALERFAADIAGDEVLAVRVRAQHDNAGFQLPGRAWQDDPACGGGTLVTIGVHAWEMVDVVSPGAELIAGAGWTRRRHDSGTRSEDVAGFSGMVRVGQVAIPVQVLVTGVAGPDAYGIEVVTAAGLRTLELAAEDANEALGFSGLARMLATEAAAHRAPAPWATSAVIVGNTVRAAEIARGETRAR